MKKPSKTNKLAYGEREHLGRAIVVDHSKTESADGVSVEEFHKQRKIQEAADLAELRRIKAESDAYTREIRMEALKQPTVES